MSRVSYGITDSQDDRETLVIIGDRVMRDVVLTLPPEMVHAIRDGYVCLECFEPQEESFPEVCQADWCAYQMRRNQAADFERRYKGEDKGLYSGVKTSDIWVP